MTRREMDRREFSVASALALLGGATITITGCGGSSSPTRSSGPVDVVGSISGNHGHPQVVITAAQLQAGGALHLDLTSGTAGHTHTVDLTSAEVVAIRSGTAVAKESTNAEAHRHTVSFVAPSGGPGQGY